MQWLSNIQWGQWLAIIISSLLFGLWHFASGPGYMLFAALAGFGYGYAYAKTKHIEGSILVHFLLNTGQILLLTYPALAIGK